jgi:transcriptional regulator with XRE-family HTH domain
VVLGAARRRRRLTVKEVEERSGVSEGTLSVYENGGDCPPSLKRLREINESFGFDAEATDFLLVAVEVADGEIPPPKDPLDATPEQAKRVRRDALRHAVGDYFLTEGRLVSDLRARRIDEDRAEAAKVARRMRSLRAKARHELDAGGALVPTWALVEALCQESAAAASDDAQLALSLARLALRAARQVAGPAAWRARLAGYAWAFIANALRVGDSRRKADAALRTAWKLWKEGVAADLPLAGWRLLDLEASLRRDQRRWKDALRLHARSLKEAPPAAHGRILVSLGAAHMQRGSAAQALKVLHRAEPLVMGSGDRRLLWALRFNQVVSLLELGRVAEVDVRLPEARQLAIVLGNELDLIRVMWLQARLDAAKGNREAALASFEQVRGDLAERKIPWDAALAGLETAVLHLEAGHFEEVRILATQMVWIFREDGVEEEELAALSLFCEATRREEITATIARQALSQFREVRRRVATPEKT